MIFKNWILWGHWCTVLSYLYSFEDFYDLLPQRATAAFVLKMEVCKSKMIKECSNIISSIFGVLKSFLSYFTFLIYPPPFPFSDLKIHVATKFLSFLVNFDASDIIYEQRLNRKIINTSFSILQFIYNAACKFLKKC